MDLKRKKKKKRRLRRPSVGLILLFVSFMELLHALVQVQAACIPLYIFVSVAVVMVML